MKLSLSSPPHADTPVVVLISGLGGSGSYWLPQLAVPEQKYQVVCYDQRGIGDSPDTPTEDYSIAQMAAEPHQALVATGIEHYAVVGHVLGAPVGVQLVLDYPASVTVLISVSGWLRINAHARHCSQARERLLYNDGVQAWMETQPLFLYPADWMAAHTPRPEAEGALALTHSQGKNNSLRRLNVFRRVDLSHHADRIRYPMQVVCTSDDLLAPTACFNGLHAALPDSQKMVVPYGGHICNVTDPKTSNALSFNGSVSLLHHREAILQGIAMNETVNPGVFSTLFTDARTYNGRRGTPVSDKTLRGIYVLMKWGLASVNCSPAWIVFTRTAEGKERLRPTLSGGNLQKTPTAPATAIVAWGSEFYERLPLPFPRGDARSRSTSSLQLTEETAFRNSSMQAVYLTVACRALRLDIDPTSGFDRQHVDDAFFTSSMLKSNLLINIGYSDSSKLYVRLPRLSFEGACGLLQGTNYEHCRSTNFSQCDVLHGRDG